MLRLGLVVLAATLAACSPYVRNESSAAAGGSAPGLMVRFLPDSGAPERTLPTDYADFRPGDRAFVRQDGKVAPM